MARPLTLPDRGFAYQGDSMVIAYLTRGSVEAPFMESLLRAYEFDRYRGPGRFTGAQWRVSVRSGVNVSRSRCQAVDQFLSTGAEWLLMVDDDMAWAPDAHERLLTSIERTARKAELDPWQIVMGGLCFAYLPQGGGTYATMFTRTPDGMFHRHEGELPPRGQVVQVAGTGAAFLLAHRVMFQRIRDTLDATQCPWFREHETLIITARDEAGEPTAATCYWVSEDLWFCDQVARVGGRLFVDTGVEVGHKKPLMLDRPFHESSPAITVA